MQQYIQDNVKSMLIKYLGVSYYILILTIVYHGIHGDINHIISKANANIFFSATSVNACTSHIKSDCPIVEYAYACTVCMGSSMSPHTYTKESVMSAIASQLLYMFAACALQLYCFLESCTVSYNSTTSQLATTNNNTLQLDIQLANQV